MRKFILIAACLLLLSGQLRAQELEESSRQVTRYQWDVATDLLWLVDKSERPPSVLVRLNQERKGKLSAYRFRLGGIYARNTGNFPNDTAGRGPIPIPWFSTSATTFAAVGREWQRQYDQFQFFYGLDVYGQYYRRRDRQTAYPKGNGRYEYLPLRERLSLGVSPLAGVRFFIHSRVSVGGEAHLNLVWHSFYYAQPSISGPQDTLRFRKQYLQARFNPLSLLYLSYHF